MSDISRLPHELDRKKRQCRAIVETPKGRRTKFKYDEKSGLFSLAKVLPQGFSFPFEFGFIPSTLGEDGDPMDVIILVDEPTHVGCLLQVRLLGAIKVEKTWKDQTITDPRLVGVPAQSFDFADIQELDHLPHDLTQQMSEFLVLYKKNSGKQDKVSGTCGAEEAMDLIEKGSRSLKEGLQDK